MKAWRVHEYGAPRDALRLEDVPLPEPGPGELRVRVAAITLNYNDLDGIYGRYRTVSPPLPYTPGMEVLGRVDAAGEGAEAWVGKRVCAIPAGAFGGYAEAALCPTAMAFEMPADLADAEAAAIYFPFHLSWLALFERGRLTRGERVLIHAAAGGVGSAAVQLAKNAGARVFATAGSDAKVAFCRELGADLAINYRREDFVEQVADATGGAGVDVVFDSVGGEVTQKSLRCLGFNGRLLLVGFAGGIEAEDQTTIAPRPLLFGNVSMCGVCHAYVDDKVAFRRQTGFNFPSHADGTALHAKVLDLLRRGAIRPIVGQRLPFAELPRAFDSIERRDSVGRSVVLLGD
jgi:NADPH2:quinone reductase